jgi:hypothetical protein
MPMKELNHQGGLIRMGKDQEHHHQVFSCAFCDKAQETETPEPGVVYLSPSLCEKMDLQDKIYMLSTLFENDVYGQFDYDFDDESEEESENLSEEIIDAMSDVHFAFERLRDLVN